MAKRKMPTLRQRTLEQSVCRGATEGQSACKGGRDHREHQQRTPAKAHKAPLEQLRRHGRRTSRRATQTISTPESGSDEISEPDPDSSEEWLPSSSERSSRASSPGEGGEVSSRGPTPDGSVEREGCSPSRGSIATPLDSGKKKGRASSRGATPTPVGGVKKKVRASSRGEGSGWQTDDWRPNQIPFTATPGPRGAAAELNSVLPADFLELFLTDELLQHIVDQTNLYAAQHFQAHPESLPHSRESAWKPVSVKELKTFLGLSFLTGYMKKPNLVMYWNVDEVDSTPYFSQTMSRNRFQIIWRFLHYNDDTSQDANDKMYKVRPVLDHVVQKFKELYEPGQHICIDEGMNQWRRRLSFRVYNPQKPIKCGIKSYILCDSATGYCFNMQPYVGTANSLPEMVFFLLDRLPGHGYTLYMDNFYNSVALCECLLAAQTNFCGTLGKNRGEPKIITELTKTELGAEGKVVRHNDRVMVVAWQDKRLVKMVTTCHQDRMQRVEVWQKGHKNKVPQFKPECVVAYNLSMNGMDKFDQNIAYYPFIRKSLNWSKKFVTYLFQICIFNAFVLYRARNPGGCKTLLEFIRRVVKSWTAMQCVGEEEEGEQVEEEDEEDEEEVGEQVEEEEEVEVAGVETRGRGELKDGRRTPRAPYNTDPGSRLDGQIGKHQLEHLMPTSRASRPKRRCRVCARRGQRSETKLWCKSCCVPLHAGECFTAYHTKVNYAVEG